ncbi:MAG: hypothetical protein ABIX46_01280, partial [Burkholderiaceae bacterium]
MRRVRASVFRGLLMVAICLAGLPLAASARPAAPASAAAPTLPPAREAERATSHNLHLFGGSVRTDGAVDGDFTGFGGRVSVDHPIGVDATLAGGSVEINAPVGDDLRVAGGSVTISAPVGGELYGAAGNLRLASTGRVAGDAALAAGSLAIDGTIGGSLRAAAQSIVINGEVVGDVRLTAERIALGPKARIGGAFSYRSQEPLNLAEGAVIGGAVSAEPAKARRPHERERGLSDEARHRRGWLPLGIGSVFGYVVLLAVAAVLVWLMPRFSARATEAV